MFGCGSLHLFLSVAGCSLSDDNYSRLWSTNIAEYHYEFFRWFFFMPVMFSFILGHWSALPLVPGPPSSVRCGLSLVAWVSSWTSHWLATPTSSVPPLPQHLSGRTNCRSEVLWLGWCPSPSTGNLGWFQKMASPDFLSPIVMSLCKIPRSFHCTRSLPHPQSALPPIPDFSPNTFLLLSSLSDLSCSHPHPVDSWNLF